MDKDIQVDMEKVLRHCSSLIRKSDDKLSFSHFSVKEYLRKISPDNNRLSRFQIDNDRDQEYLGTTCLAYILLDSNIPLLHMSLNWEEFTEKLKIEHPFLEYAARHWVSHSRASIGSSQGIFGLAAELFNINKSDQFILWTILWLFHIQSFRFPDIDDALERIGDVTSLHMSCMIRLPAIVQLLIKNGADVNSTCKELSTALMCAVGTSKHLTFRDTATTSEMYGIVRSLISGGISVDPSLLDPLASAIRRDDSDLVSILRKGGFPLRKDLLSTIWPSQGIPHSTIPPPQVSSHSTIKALLEDSNWDELDSGVQLQLKNVVFAGVPVTLKPVPSHSEEQHKDIIRRAASQGQSSKIKGLLAQSRQYTSLTGVHLAHFLSECLGDAAQQGHTKTVTCLFTEGADIAYQRDGDERTALHRAASEGRYQTVEWILDISKGDSSITEVDDADGLTPWMCAVRNGHPRILQLFLHSKPEMDLYRKTKLGYGAAHLAIHSQDRHLFQLLEGLGLDVTCKASDGKTPLHLLLEYFADHRSKFGVPLDDPGYPRELLQHLVRKPQSLSDETDSGDNILHCLARIDPRDAMVALTELSNDTTRFPELQVALCHQNASLMTPFHVSLDDYFDKYGGFDPMSLWVDVWKHLIPHCGPDQAQLFPRDSKGRTPIVCLAQKLQSRWRVWQQDDSSSEKLQSFFRILLEKYPDKSVLDRTGDEMNTAMHHIAMCKRHPAIVEIAEMLIHHGVDLKAKNKIGRTPLACACWEIGSDVGFIQALMPYMKTTDWEQQDKEGSSPLHYLIKSKDEKYRQELITEQLFRIATCTVRDGMGHIPLTYAPESVTDHSTASKLISLAKDNIRLRGLDGRDIMYRSCELGANVMATALLDHGVDPNEVIGGKNPAVDRERCSDLANSNFSRREPPLLIAARAGHIDTVSLLLENGASPLGKGEDNWQLLHFALSSGTISSHLRRILEDRDDTDYEAPVSRFKFGLEDWAHGEGIRPIHVAAGNEDIGALNWLLCAGRVSNVDEQSADGLTAFYVACRAGHQRHCEMLISRGASITKTNSRGWTPFMAACYGGHTNICRYLSSIDESFISAEAAGLLPIEVAAASGHASLVRLLLRMKCEINLAAQSKALQRGHNEVANLIRK